MTNYAYLRVSTNDQDVKNQKHGILEYTNKNDFSKLVYIEDTASGKTKWQERKLGQLMLENASKGDNVFFAEFTRMGRSTLQVLEVMEHALAIGINIYITKQDLKLADNIQSKIYATVLGLAGDIERDFIKQRTTESLANRKAQIKEKGYFRNKSGQKVTALGRPKGKASSVKLDEKRDDINEMLEKKISISNIAKMVECSRSTLYDWIAREKEKGKQAKSGGVSE